MKFITLTEYREGAKVRVSVNHITAIHLSKSITSGAIIWLDGSELIVRETPEVIEEMIIVATQPILVAEATGYTKGKTREFCGNCFTDQLSG